jgi:hypothetical protein
VRYRKVREEAVANVQVMFDGALRSVFGEDLGNGCGS